MGADLSCLLEGPALPWQIAVKSSPLAVTASATDLSQCCCPELDVSSELSFQDPSKVTWPVRLPCPGRILRLIGLDPLCWTVFGGAADRQEMEGGKRHPVTCHF